MVLSILYGVTTWELQSIKDYPKIVLKSRKLFFINLIDACLVSLMLIRSGSIHSKSMLRSLYSAVKKQLTHIVVLERDVHVFLGTVRFSVLQNRWDIFCRKLSMAIIDGFMLKRELN